MKLFARFQVLLSQFHRIAGTKVRLSFELTKHSPYFFQKYFIESQNIAFTRGLGEDIYANEAGAAGYDMRER